MQALEVLTKAFQLFPRLGYISQPAGGRGGDTTVVFRSWSSNAANQIRYHNAAKMENWLGGVTFSKDHFQ